MLPLADLPELVGFFSYSRRDDQNSEGALTRLRARIYSELRLQLGRELRLWQDTAAIPDGSLWEHEIKSAIAEAVFFVPIVTPSAVGSKHCRLEFTSFLKREEELGRSNLIFPLLYVRVPALEHEEQWRDDAVLGTIGARQYLDWQDFRHRDPREPEVARRIELFCRNIVEALRQPWFSMEERRTAEAARARQADEDEAIRRRQAEAARERSRQEQLAREAEQRRQIEQAARQAREQDDKARRIETERQHRETGKVEPAGKASRAQSDVASPAVSAAFYFVGSYLTISGAFWVLADVTLWVTLSRLGGPAGGWLAASAFTVVALAAIGAGFGTMQGGRWARFVGIAVCLVIVMLAGFVAVENVIDPVPNVAVRPVLEVYAVINVLAATACLYVYLVGWKPNTWLNSAILRNQNALLVSVLLLASLTLLFFFLAANASTVLGDAAALWLGAALIMVAAASFYCVKRFRQFSASG
jgi:hypothetical protein